MNCLPFGPRLNLAASFAVIPKCRARSTRAARRRTQVDGELVHNSPRKARCCSEANSASSSASDARCAVFSFSTARTRRANSRCNSMGGSGTRKLAALTEIDCHDPLDPVAAPSQRMSAAMVIKRPTKSGSSFAAARANRTVILGMHSRLRLHESRTHSRVARRSLGRERASLRLARVNAYRSCSCSTRLAFVERSNVAGRDVHHRMYQTSSSMTFTGFRGDATAA